MNNINIFLLIIIMLVIQGCGGNPLTAGKAQKAIENIDLIASKLDAYIDKYEDFPDHTDILVEQGFLGRFPANPYSDTASIRQVPFTSAAEGDFTYLKVYKGRHTEDVMYYVLILWGPENYENNDVLDVGFDYDNYHFLTWEQMSDGVPDRHLKIIKGSEYSVTGERAAWGE